MRRQRFLKANGVDPCPFCGAEIPNLIRDDESVMLECPECHVSLHVYADEYEDCVKELKRRWNSCPRKKTE